jgi:hypothetical protein
VANGKLFGDRAVGAVAIVEAPVSQWYMRRARIAFLTVSMGAALVAAALLAVFLPLLLAVALGIVAGAACGLVAGLLVRSWPVLRVLWWWSAEITAAAVVVVGPSLLARQTSRWVAFGPFPIL